MEALRDLRVVEIGGDIACAYASKLLADLGADVVKIEPPEGDPLRLWGPFKDGKVDPEEGGLARYLNANKRSMVIDLDGPGAVEKVRALLVGADVVIESDRPGRLEKRGLGLDVLRDLNPRIALVRISPFGQTGPYRDLEATELVIQAAGGWVSAHGLPGSAAVRVGGRIPEYLVGSFAATAALTAVRAARDKNSAVDVDVSMMECLVGTLPYPMMWAETLRKMGMPPPQKRRTPLPGVLRCKDAWVGVNVLTAQQWEDTCTLFEVPQFAQEQKNIQSDFPVAQEFFDAIQPWLKEHTADEIVTLGQAFRIPTVWIGSGDTLERFDQFRERPFFVQEPGRDWKRPGFPYRLAKTPAAIRTTAPRLGEHTWALDDPWAAREEPVVPTRKKRPNGRPDVEGLPFRDLRVLDLGTFWAGPFVGMYFASHGADVIKVESVQRPDGFRFSQTYPQLGEDYYEHSTTYQGSNHGKRDLTLDLRQEEARDLLLGLLADTDVLIENFSPRVMENFGLTYEKLIETKPDLIMVRMPGFGLEGPWRDYVGWATVIEQAAGMTWVTGHPGGPPLNPGGFIDCGVSMHVGVALQSALMHRERTGEGQHIEVAQLETGTCLTPEQIIEHTMNGTVLGRYGNRDRDFAPQGAYPTNEGAWVAFSVRTDEEWSRLVEALERPEWATAPALGTLSGRVARHDEIDAKLTEWTKQRSAADVVAVLRERRIPVSEALVATKMYGEPQLEARGFYQALDHPRSGERRYPTWPMRFSYGPEPQYATVAPTLGQHNAEILSGELGLSKEDLERLESTSIIGDRMAG
ncbi:MAG: CoA transferase [Candidatus Binatia bacterium]|nr:CoA transferase [Candidatus Binatia bacterium]